MDVDDLDGRGFSAALRALEQHRHPLAYAHTHRDDGVAGPRSLQVFGSGERESSTTHSQGMAQRN